MVTKSPRKKQVKRTVALATSRIVDRRISMMMMIPLVLFSGAVFGFEVPGYRLLKLFQVTWLTHTGFTYDRNNLSKVKQFTHQMKDGWGLATDGKVLFGSDGSSTLYRINPRTLKITDKHTVRYNGHEVKNLNELEHINGEVWANVWETDCIARISPKDGSLLGWILLPELRQGLSKSGHRGSDVLNGIAWDGEKHRIFVTGKLWPKLYQIKLKPASEMRGKHIERQYAWYKNIIASKQLKMIART